MKEDASEKKADAMTEETIDEGQGESIKRLYRSRKDRMIAGVCGGIAEYLNIDPVWVRLIAVLSVLANGIGIIAYILAWILVPLNPTGPEIKDRWEEKMARHKEKLESKFEARKARMEARFEARAERRRGYGVYLVGLLLIAFGGIFLAKQFLPWLSYGYIWPLLIIAVGLYFIFRR